MQPDSKINEKNASIQPMKPNRILIVEDEEDMVKLLNYRLEKEQYQTMIATTGRQACALIESFQPHCILLDIMLPEMSGWQVCRFVRNHPDSHIASTPIIMLTALGDQNARIKGLELGADGYIAKPYSIREVLINCDRLVGERGRQLRLRAEITRLQNENRISVDLQSLLCHELKNHLTVIQGFCSRLNRSMQKELTNKERRYTGLIDRSASYLLNITEEVLLIRQVETGTIELKKKPFRLGEALGEVLSLYEQIAAAKEITIRSHCPATETAELNRNAFKLLLSSLLENAIKYSFPMTEICCSVTLPENGRTLVLKVEDQGPGIPEEEQEKIFEKYYRGRKHRELTRGTGIGLYTVRVLCKALEARIELQSEEGRGSGFSILLPLQDGGQHPNGDRIGGGQSNLNR